MKENFIKDLFSLEGKVALVTGAGRGIGQVIARDLARAGADIAIFSRSGAADSVRLIEGEGGKALDIIADCTKEDQVKAGFEKILEVYGRIDVVVNNAGVCYHKDIFEATVYHGEYESLTTKYALTFSDGTLLVSPLAHCQWNLSGYDGSSTKRYFMPFRGRDAGKEISAARYETIQKEEFPDCEYRSVTFSWRSAGDLKTAASNGELKKSLADSFACFNR